MHLEIENNCCDGLRVINVVLISPYILELSYAYYCCSITSSPVLFRIDCTCRDINAKKTVLEERFHELL